MFGNDFSIGGGGPSELQEKILRTSRRNPDAGANEIASMCGCSASYVRETLKEHGGLNGLL